MRRLASLSHRHAASAAGALAISLLLATATGAAAQIHPGSYVTVFHTTTVAAGHAGAATATCPTGNRAITGGAYWHRSGQNGDPALLAVLRSSAPTSDMLGWYTAGANDSAETLYLTTTVQCLPKNTVGSFTVKSREVTVDPVRPGNADLRCGAGQKVMSGGGVWHKPGQAPKAGLIGRLTGSIPDTDGNGWTVIGRNDGTSILNLRVTALCVSSSVIGAATSDTFFVPGSFNGTPEHYLVCPTGTLAIGGGYYWTHQTYAGGLMNFDTRNTIVSSTVTGDGTSWYAGARNTDNFETTTFSVWYVRCLPA